MRECNRYKLELADFVKNKLSVEEKKDFVRHLANCQDCQRELKEIESLIETLKEEQEVKLSETFWSSFPAQIRDKIEKQKQREKSIKPAWILAPAAAVLALFVVVSLFNVDQQFLSKKMSDPEGTLVWLEGKPSQSQFAMEFEGVVEDLNQVLEKEYWQNEDLAILLAELSYEEFIFLEEKITKLKF